MRPSVTFLIVLLAAPFGLIAQEVGSAWLGDVASRIATHFGLEGELVLSALNAGSFSIKADAPVSIIEFPASVTPQFPLRVRVDNENGNTQEHVVMVRANLWRFGWKLRQPSQRGDLLDPAILEAARVDALRDRDAVTSLPANGHVFTRSVQKDRLLTWRDLAARPDVRRGQIVEVIAQNGPVSVSLKGLAMQDGAKSETIRVRNLQSNREFTAEVTGPSRALIRL